MQDPVTRFPVSRWPESAVALSLCCMLLTSVTAEPPSVGALQTLIKRFQLETEAGNTEQAADTAGDMIAMGEQLMGAGDPNILRMGVTRAVLLRNLGKYDDAQAVLRKTIAQAKAKLGEQHAVTALGTSTLGTVHRLKGELADARKHYEQAIAVLDQLGDDAATDRAEAYANYADLLAETGEPATARKFLTDAIAINEKTFGRRHQRTATCLNNLGLLLLTLGDNEAAEKTLRDSLVLHQILYGKEHAEVVTSWSNLGKLLVARGKYPEAIDAYQSALSMAKRKLSANHPTTLSIQNNLGQLYSETGESERAITLLTETLNQQTQILGEQHPSTATTRHNLGAIYAGRHDLARAQPLLLRSAEYFEQPDVNNKTNAAGARAYLGVAEANANHVDAAIEQFNRCRANTNEAAWNSLPKLSNNEQQKFMRSKFDWTLYTSLSLAFLHPQDDAVLAATAEWLANGKGIAAEALAAARNDTPDKLHWVTLEEVRQAIPENAVWIDILRQDYIDLTASEYKDQLHDPRYVAWIVSAKGPVVRVDLGDAAEIDALVSDVRHVISAAGGPRGQIATLGELEATKVANDILTKIGKRVWTPLQDKLPKDTQKILLSPDGGLWLLPWSAIPLAEDQFLIQRYAVTTFASGRMLCDRHPVQPDARSNSAVFSNPEFDQPVTKKRTAFQAVFDEVPAAPQHGLRSAIGIDRGILNATPLPGTAVEAAAVEPSITKWLGGKQPVQYRGTFALESIAKRLTSPRSIVFATHGFFNDDAQQVFDPLSRCGLLLSGCNDEQSVLADDDGILTGAEISQMQLEGTELVVLSACETGIGRVENGNGVAGLRRAFHLAGARSVVSTLWQIPDFDSAKLMVEFFSHVADEISKEDALRAAQIARIESRTKRHGAAHPFFWAGYGMSGR